LSREDHHDLRDLSPIIPHRRKRPLPDVAELWPDAMIPLPTPIPPLMLPDEARADMRTMVTGYLNDPPEPKVNSRVRMQPTPEPKTSFMAPVNTALIESEPDYARRLQLQTQTAIPGYVMTSSQGHIQQVPPPAHMVLVTGKDGTVCKPYDISMEEYREYCYGDGSVLRIHHPLALYVMANGSHRIVDSHRRTHRPTPGWIDLIWRNKDHSAPPFDF